MQEKYTISLAAIEQELALERIVVPDHYEDILITTPEVNRPGLVLSGFTEHFERARIQLLGNAEHRFLRSLPEEERAEKLNMLVEAKPVAIIVTSGLKFPPALEQSCRRCDVPLFSSTEGTNPLMAALFASLNVHLAPRITRHGVLVDVYGEGILILGDSGVGKSETAIELIKRGHRLIADDAVEIKRVSARRLVGSAPEIIRHYVELRGIGIVDIRRLFGMGAVKDTEAIDLVVNLEPWVQGKMYDRLGLDEEKINILGLELPVITIPVHPGQIGRAHV